MISKLYKLLAVLLIVALALYVVLLNREPATVYLSSQVKVSAAAGVVYIALFCLGILFTTTVALWFGIKSYIRERRLLYRDRQRQEFYTGMLKARSYTSSGEWLKAASEWQDLLHKDPTDIIAQVELSRCLEHSGDQREALKVLESARQADPNNTEVLFRAAELNLVLNNKTSAVDNLVLILHNHPNRRAATMARDISEEMERFSDALEYEARLSSFGAGEDGDLGRAKLEFKRVLFEARANPAGLDAALRVLVKKYADYGPALKKLSELEIAHGKIEEGVQLLVKAAKLEQKPEYWFEAAKIWLKSGNPDRAVAAARSATRETSGQARVDSELDLIRLFLSLNMHADARTALDKFEDLAQQQQVTLDKDTSHEYLVLKGLYFNSIGENHRSSEIWQRLCDSDFDFRSRYSRPVTLNGHSAPSPSLSTP